ncbi:hypothetical protein A9Q84_03000 [Halobacteriovorax marinus]|uniref:Uncharacterized protein n=1 Tax=Halobacteriovorax marinus TaxID=97084 RepID=A0A1Y5FGW3_9BACT|nr:hypothetical protein A9Q84_03000 [Halobacteriovorax marinus]
MFKDFFKIQFIAILILVLNAVATQNIKLIPKTETKSAKTTKVVNAEKKSLKKIQFPKISAANPRGMLLQAIEKSLN